GGGPGRGPDDRRVDGAGGACAAGTLAQRDPRSPAAQRRGAPARGSGRAAAGCRAVRRPAGTGSRRPVGRRGAAAADGGGGPVAGASRRRAAVGGAPGRGCGKGGPLMTAARWLEELRSMVVGSVKVNEPLQDHVTLQIGGPVEAMVFPATQDDLVRVVRWCLDRGVPYGFLGFGSNVLPPDEGLPGVMLRTKPALDYIRFEERRVFVGTGASVARLV